MSNRKTVFFKKSLVAVAVLSISACSSTPRIDDYDLSKIGDGILKAGRTTAEISGKAWAKTTYLLGFSDDAVAAGYAPEDSMLNDHSDVALLTTEELTLPDGTVIHPADIPQLTATPLADEPVLSGEATEQAAVTLGNTQIQAKPLTAEPMASAEQSIEEVVGVEDLMYEVSPSETLWDISKLTTGDANNWHILADVNNLAPNAAVYPGQQLLIPADMVKVGYFDANEAPVESLERVAQAPSDINAGELMANDAQALASDEPISMASVDSAARSIEQSMPLPEEPAIQTVKETIGGKAFKLKTGETLWDFSKRTTGDATNWQAVANHNRFTERQAVVVRPGQTIMVPLDLVKPELKLADNAVQAPGSEASSTQITAAAVPEKMSVNLPVVAKAEPEITLVEDEPALSVSDDTLASDSRQDSAVQASSELLAEATQLDAQPMTIVEATYKTEAPVEPMMADSDNAMTFDQDALNSIMVSGTYYPKAIYNEADFSSSLLMRVSPGTTLLVSRAMGSWFEVETNKGVGYVHQRDIK